MSVNVAAIRTRLALAGSGGYGSDATSDLSAHAYADLSELLDEVERLRATSEGVDMLVAQAERRGAVKALRSAVSELVTAEQVAKDVPHAEAIARLMSAFLTQHADAIEQGAAL